MHKLVVALAVSAAFAALPVAPVAAGDDNSTGKHHHARHRAPAPQAEYPEAVSDPSVRDGYRVNGTFDWRHRGKKELPWYANGYNDGCVAWEQNAYHYACDVNSRY